MGPINLQSGRITARSAASTSSGQSADQEQALRTQIQSEIERKAKFCANTQYECTLRRVDSYAYCFRHILQDPNAPYKQCGYIFSNGRRCLEPSPKYDAKKDYGSNFCFEHSRQTQLKKTKSTIGKLVPVETTETLLHGLAHHVKVDKHKQQYMGNSTPLKITVHEDDDDNDVDVVTPSVDPFVDVDVTAINDSGRIVLDYASDSSSDDERTFQPTFGTSWKGHEMDNSDNESVDSQGDDPLKHAGIYTAEEVTRITKEKLTRLQSLYIEQIHRLQHVLRERRRNYLKDQRAERDIHCSIYDQIKETPRERMLYEKLKGLMRYHRKHGVEAILQRKYLEKRAKATEGLQQKPPSLPKCTYTEGGVKCGERTLPCCKHCRKHILEDKKQVLFRACGIEKSGVVCQEPLAGLFENVTCPLHMDLPAQRSFNKRKYESESDGEGDPVPTDVSQVVGAEKPDHKPLDKDGGAAGTTSEGAGDKNVEKTEPKEGETDVKPLVKPENKRRANKTEPATITPSRARSTRASRSALARRDDSTAKPTELVATPEAGLDVKQEKVEPVENERNVTIAHDAASNVASVGDSILDLEENLLPVNIIPKKKPKLDDEAKPIDQVPGGKVEVASPAQQPSVAETPVDKTPVVEQAAGPERGKSPLEEKQSQDGSKTGQSPVKDKPEQDEPAKPPQRRTSGTRQRKQREQRQKSTDKKDGSTATKPDDAGTASNLSDAVSVTSDEEKGNKAKQAKGKPDPVSTGGGSVQKNVEPKSRRQQK